MLSDEQLRKLAIRHTVDACHLTSTVMIVEPGRRTWATVHRVRDDDGSLDVMKVTLKEMNDRPTKGPEIDYTIYSEEAKIEHSGCSED